MMKKNLFSMLAAVVLTVSASSAVACDAKETIDDFDSYKWDKKLGFISISQDEIKNDKNITIYDGYLKIKSDEFSMHDIKSVFIKYMQLQWLDQNSILNGVNSSIMPSKSEVSLKETVRENELYWNNQEKSKNSLKQEKTNIIFSILVLSNQYFFVNVDSNNFFSIIFAFQEVKFAINSSQQEPKFSAVHFMTVDFELTR